MLKVLLNLYHIIVILVIANSGLTATINSEIFNIKSDYIINVGLGYEFIDSIDYSASLSLNRKNKNILFAGKLALRKKMLTA